MDYGILAQQIIQEQRKLTKTEALNILSSDSDWWQIYAAALHVKTARSQNRIRLNYLLNAKSGLCSEDCGYCAQSIRSTAPIQKYNLLPKSEIIRKALIAKKNHASTFCIATSGTRPNEAELKELGEAITTIKQELNLEVCVSIGLLAEEQITYLKTIGVDRVNHNLNTPKEHYAKITTTHSYADRVRTLDQLNQANLHICSGLICGMGETLPQLVDLAFDLKQKQPYSIPINFLLPIEGTALAEQNDLTPLKCLKILAMMRLLFPNSELRISAGREYHLGKLQGLAIVLVDSIFLGNYLTEVGDPIQKDLDLLQTLGLEIVEG